MKVIFIFCSMTKYEPCTLGPWFQLSQTKTDIHKIKKVSFLNILLQILLQIFISCFFFCLTFSFSFEFGHDRTLNFPVLFHSSPATRFFLYDFQSFRTSDGNFISVKRANSFGSQMLPLDLLLSKVIMK